MKRDIVALNRKAWNRVADQYAKLGYGKITHTFRYFVSKLQPHSWVLDIGSGTGVPFAAYLVEGGFKVVGIDVSSRMVQIARLNVPFAEFYEKSMTEMNYKTEFQGILASYSLLLLDPPLFQDVSKLIVRALKQGGLFYLALNEPSSDDEDPDDNVLVEIMGETMYSRAYTEDEVRKVFIPLGMQLMKLSRSIIHTPEFGVENMVEYVFKKGDSILLV